MSLCRVFVFSLAALGWSCGSWVEAQAPKPPETGKKQAAALQKLQQATYQYIDTKPFAEAMPLAKFLELLERQLPECKRISFLIDKEAFADQYAGIAAIPIALPQTDKQMILHRMLQLARSKIKTKHDYRLGDAGEYILTTPERALYTAVHDIGELLAKPESVFPMAQPWSPVRPWNSFKENVGLRNLDLPEKAARVVREIVAVADLAPADATSFDKATIQVLNSHQLVIRANADKHAEVSALIQAYRRLSDLWVTAGAKLYEVDDAFYTKLKNAPPINWEEEERIFLGQAPPRKGENLFAFLPKQKMILAGEEIKVEDGFIGTLLSRHHAVTFLPSREQVVAGKKSPQVALEGVAFLAGMRISPDRRCVRVQLTEKAAEINQIKKVKVMVTNDGKEVDAEIPFIKEASHLREFEIPDGGTILMPVHYRPKSLADKNRWWVLSITPRIVIPEEEEHILQGHLEQVLPMIVADVLKNPRLKVNRDFFGTPGDTRFALVNSEVWTWHKEIKLDLTGHQRTPATRDGKRLLGIRIDRAPEMMGPTIAVTLVNAGGSDNGPVLGGGTIHYATRSTEKGPVIELVESR